MTFADRLNETCDTCGENLFSEITLDIEAQALFGEKKIVKHFCKCEREKMLKEEAEAKAREEKLKLEKMLGASMMNKQLQAFTFENWNFDLCAKKWHDMGQRYCEKWKDIKIDNLGLYISGPVGTGKSYLTAAIANKLMKQGIPVAYINMIQFIERIYQTYGGKEDAAHLVRSLDNASLLIIDDLGAEHTSKSEKEKEIIFRVLDGRIRIKKPLIITSNFSIDEIKNKLDYDGIGRSADRLIEMCTPINMSGESIRQKKTSENTNKLRDLLRG